MNPNRPARLNRSVLALHGLLCLAAGGVVLLVGTGLAAGRLPVPPDAPLLPPGPALPGWVPAVVAAVAVIIGLLALRWLIAQTIRRPAGSTWQLSPDTTTGTTRIDTDAAVRPLADEIEDLPGVRSATARLTGPHAHPHLHLRVSADDHADISDLRRRIDEHAIPRLTHALNLPVLRADMLLRLVAVSDSRIR
jgi:hypothetical protein